MTRRTARTHLVLSISVAALAGATFVPAARLLVGGPVGWTVAGWASMSAIGVAAGAWLAFEHGKPGVRFLKALFIGTTAKLFVAAIGAGLAVWTGGDAPKMFLLGLGAGYVPLQAFEMIWFYLLTGQPSVQESR